MGEGQGRCVLALGAYKMKGNIVSCLWSPKDFKGGIFNLPNASLCLSLLTRRRTPVFHWSLLQYPHVISRCSFSSCCLGQRVLEQCCGAAGKSGQRGASYWSEWLISGVNIRAKSKAVADQRVVNHSAVFRSERCVGFFVLTKKENRAWVLTRVVYMLKRFRKV